MPVGLSFHYLVLLRNFKLMYTVMHLGKTLVMDPVQKAMLYCYRAQVNDAVQYLGQAIKFTVKCREHCLLMMQWMKPFTLGIC